ncbi:Gp37-like protein [Brevibacterium gallinarum]|uniref:Gp28/Gp37-like domain-containing protein n=1 Tax=Brevibacterium gallinarum TaxID=2762220 RepID=A0ABR8WQN1_9MICO|nr:hypothetical protein [Brevibacterium gallinarum]MBD8019396.1 hypothetical protein [Brevibacterium gallinarum]
MFTATLYDRQLRRRGRIVTASGTVLLRNNGVATFTIDVPDTRTWRRFEPGWHITLHTDTGEQIISGQPDQITAESKAGVTTTRISGRSHLAWLADTITLPNPARPADQQSDAASWTANGRADTIAAQLITTHLGPTAHHTRRRPIALAGLPGVGRQVQVASRFQPLIEELRSILGAELGIVSWLEDGQVRVEIRPVADRSRRVRFSEASGGLTGWKLERKAPSVTDVLVAGQGQGAQRTLRLVSGNASEWGVSALQFQDRRDTDELAELVKAGEETLAEGQEQAAISLEVTDTQARRFLRDFTVGDTVTVSLRSGVEIVDVVQSGQIDWSTGGVEVKLQVGPVAEELDAPGWVKRTTKLTKQLRRIAAV